MIIIRIWEGLGNQMFQYAFARALQEKGYCVRLDMDKAYNNQWFENRRNDTRRNALRCFNISVPLVTVEKDKRFNFLRRSNCCEKIVCYLAQKALWPIRYYREENLGYKKNLEFLKGCWYLQGTFQSVKYFEGIRNILLQEFTSKNEIKIPLRIKQILADRNTISIHVRRGDYVRLNHALSVYYYAQAVAYVKEKIKDPLFVVFSDDIKWVRTYLELPEDSLYISEELQLRDYEELLIMSKCKSNIISNSTFSWWAAWLNQNPNKCVIAPRTWFDGQDELILQDWVII